MILKKNLSNEHATMHLHYFSLESCEVTVLIPLNAMKTIMYFVEYNTHWYIMRTWHFGPEI